jgi:hypothetical protein
MAMKIKAATTSAKIVMPLPSAILTNSRRMLQPRAKYQNALRYFKIMDKSVGLENESRILVTLRSPVQN